MSDIEYHFQDVDVSIEGYQNSYSADLFRLAERLIHKGFTVKMSIRAGVLSAYLLMPMEQDKTNEPTIDD